MNDELKNQLIIQIKKTRTAKDNTSNATSFYLEEKKLRSRLNKRQTPLQIKRSVIDDLYEAQQLLAQMCGYYLHDTHYNTLALAFLLGQKDNVITDLELIYTNSGCGWMPTIYSDSLNEAMFKLITKGCCVAGIARVGLNKNIRTYQEGNRPFGAALHDLLRAGGQQGLAFLSVNRGTFNLQYPNRSMQKYVNYSYKIISERRTQNGKQNNKSNISKTGRPVSCRHSKSRNNSKRLPREEIYQFL